MDYLLDMAVAVGTSAYGWLKNSLADYSKTEHGWKFWKAFQVYEINKLVKTVLSIVVLSVGGEYALPIDETQAAYLAGLLVIIAGQVKSKVKKP